MTFIRSFSGHVYCERASIYMVGKPCTAPVYLKLKPSLSPLAMMPRPVECMAFAKISFHSASHQGCSGLCMDLIGLILPPALGVFCEWPFLWHDTLFCIL